MNINSPYAERVKNLKPKTVRTWVRVAGVGALIQHCIEVEPDTFIESQTALCGEGTGVEMWTMWVYPAKKCASCVKLSKRVAKPLPVPSIPDLLAQREDLNEQLAQLEISVTENRAEYGTYGWEQTSYAQTTFNAIGQVEALLEQVKDQLLKSGHAGDEWMMEPKVCAHRFGFMQCPDLDCDFSGIPF